MNGTHLDSEGVVEDGLSLLERRVEVEAPVLLDAVISAHRSHQAQKKRVFTRPRVRTWVMLMGVTLPASVSCAR